MSSAHDFDKHDPRDMKEGGKPQSPRPASVIEAHDYELHAKKDCPPRFSTLFQDKAEIIGPREHDRYPPPRRRPGIFISMPVLIFIALAFFFESTLLFTYTVIGLYNNLPSGFVPGHATMATTCDCAAADRQAPINIAPNFIMAPAGQAPVTETVTASQATPFSELLPSSTSSTSSSSTSSASSTASVDPSSAAAAIASDVLVMLHSGASTAPSTSSASITSTTTETRPTIFTTVTPPGGTVTSVLLQTATLGRDGKPTPFQLSTTTTTDLEASSSLADAASSSTAVPSVSSKQAVPASSSTPTPTALHTSTIAPSTSASPPPPPSSTVSSAPPPTSTAAQPVGKVCMGGSGAVEQNCV